MKLTFFHRNIISMFKGNLVAQIISVIGALLIAKIYGPDAYGIYAVYLSISTIISIPNTLQLEYAVVISNDKEEGSKIMNSILVLPLIISAIYLGILFLLSDKISENYNIITVYIAVFTAILMAQNKGLSSFLILQKKFKSLSTTRIVTSISTVVFQLLLFYIFSEKGLILGSLIGVFVTSIYYYKLNWKFISKFDYNNLRKAIIKYKNLVKYALLSNFINTLANNIMPVLILAYFSSSQSGTYALSLKILATPLFLISSSVSQVYFEKASKLLKISKGKLFNFTKKIVINNLIIMSVAILLINLIGIHIIVYFFGENWNDINLFILLLSFLILTKSSFNPISSIVEVTNKNHIDLIFNTYLLTVNLIGFYVGYIYSDLFYTLLIISLLGGIGYLIILWYFMKELKSYTLYKGANNQKNRE